MPKYHVTLSGYPVTLDYDYDKPETPTKDHPGFPPVVLINKVIITPTIVVDPDCIHPELVSLWEDAIVEMRKED